jgi:hypothetical protein
MWFKAGIPWALAIAMVIVAAVELFVRSAEPKHVISYAYGKDEYFAAANHLDAYGPADVCFVGSSRAKEAIVVLSSVQLRLCRGAGRRNSSAGRQLAGQGEARGHSVRSLPTNASGQQAADGPFGYLLGSG